MQRNPPIIAILRGVKPAEAATVATALCEAGICRIEAPLNQPDAFTLISEMASAVGEAAEIGAGTVLTTEDVEKSAASGAQFIVSPNLDVDVIARTKTLGLRSYPGVFTPTECFAALQAGADGLKLFPAFLLGPTGVGALGTVMPPDTELYATGGAGPENFADYFKAGATGFGLGSCLYKPGWTAQQVGEAAEKVLAAFDAAASQPG